MPTFVGFLTARAVGLDLIVLLLNPYACSDMIGRAEVVRNICGFHLIVATLVARGAMLLH